MPGDQQRRRSFSPSRGPAAPPGTRMYGTLRQKRSSPSSPSQKPPQPLRHAVANCLSASLHGSPSALASDASRTLRDYIVNSTTRDIAYNVLIEHALAERDRSPAVVSRCVALLKHYLLRYTPKVQILRQIDIFCANSIAECGPITHQEVHLRPKSQTQISGPPTVGSNGISSLTLASDSESTSLVKSLNHVRSLVTRHIPKLSFQPLALSETSTSDIQSMPTLSSLLTRPFASHLNSEPKSRDSPERNEASSPSALNVSSLEINDEGEGNKCIFSDLLLERWSEEKDQQSSPFIGQSGPVTKPQDIHPCTFLEVGAAAFLVGDIETKVKEQPWKYFATQSLYDVDHILQPSSAAPATNFVSSESRLKAVTASKRMKQAPHHIWHNVPFNTYQPRARPLFQYRHYSEQQPLRLNPAEVSEVIAEVCSDTSLASMNILNAPLQLSNPQAHTSVDVAVSVLVKLVIDMFVMDPMVAAPLTQLMLEDMLSSPKVVSRTRVFDLILNLGIHAHLLEPIYSEDNHVITGDKISEDHERPPVAPRKMFAESKMQKTTLSVLNEFESWILVIFYDVLQYLVQVEEREEIVWASALSCLFYFVCDKEKIVRGRLEGLDIRVVKTLLVVSRENSWAEIINCKLVCMLTNMLYKVGNGPTESVSKPPFLIEQVDLVGGTDFICLEYSRACMKEERHNLFLVLFDYVLHQINEACTAVGTLIYNDNEIQPVASLLILANAAEAFYISVKHGMEGFGEILRRSISAALSRPPNYERSNLLLEKITRKLDHMTNTFTQLDCEFSFMFQASQFCTSLTSIEGELGETALKARVSWATLNSLLHSDKFVYRHNGFIWLVELLLLEIKGNDDRSIWSNIKRFQQYVGVAGSQDLSYSSVPLPFVMMCGLLKSKHNTIRWGFLFVLERFLIRFKLLLDEYEMHHVGLEDVFSCDQTEVRLCMANSVIDVMSCALSLMVQINETDHINILKMCDILFSQVCLRLSSFNGMVLGDLKDLGHLFGRTNESFKIDLEAHVLYASLSKNIHRSDLPGSMSIIAATENAGLARDSIPIAALLLQGQAIVPMQLVTHVPVSLFYWPLIQLASAATDDIRLGVAVGSKGRGNIPGAASDIRAAILLLLIGKCTADQKAFQEVEGEEFFRSLLDDTDSRVAYYSSVFLLKRMMMEEPDNYQHILQSLIFKAQQSNNEKLLENPYLQMRGILQLSNGLGTL